MRVALRGRRAAQLADRLDERIGVERRDRRRRPALGQRGGACSSARGLHQRFVERIVAARVEPASRSAG